MTEDTSGLKRRPLRPSETKAGDRERFRTDNGSAFVRMKARRSSIRVRRTTERAGLVHGAVAGDGRFREPPLKQFDAIVAFAMKPRDEDATLLKHVPSFVDGHAHDLEKPGRVETRENEFGTVTE